MAVVSRPRKRSPAPTSEQSTSMPPLRRRPAWALLEKHYQKLKAVHLHKLFADDRERGARLAIEAVGLYLDYSKNRITDETLRLLLQLAHESGLRERIDAMFRGDKINVSENRAVLHVALRAPRGARSYTTVATSSPKSMPFSTGWPILQIGCAAVPGKAIPESVFAM